MKTIKNNDELKIKKTAPVEETEASPESNSEDPFNYPNMDYLNELILDEGLAENLIQSEPEQMMVHTNSASKKKLSSKKNPSDYAKLDLEELRKSRPEAAIHSISVDIHTRPAYGLVLGRRYSETQNPHTKRNKVKQTILGLYPFATKTQMMIQASFQYDSPVAQWALIRIETLLNQFETSIDRDINTVRQLLKNLESNGIRCQQMSSRKPVTVDVNFHSAYGLWFIYLIGKYDLMGRLYLPIRHLQVVSHDEYRQFIHHSRKIVREMMHIAKIFSEEDQSITREEIYDHLSEKNSQKKVGRMLKRFGPIPDEVLTGKQKPLLIYPNQLKELSHV